MSNNTPQEVIEVEVEEQKQEGRSQGDGNKRGNKILDYTLQPLEGAVAFAINFQSKEVSEFLRKNGGEYIVTNGIRIVQGLMFPEWKLSNDEIRLDGSGGRKYGRPDITRFPDPAPEFRNKGNTQYRDNAMARFNNAMAEFVKAVKEFFGRDTMETQSKFKGRVILS